MAIEASAFDQNTELASEKAGVKMKQILWRGADSILKRLKAKREMCRMTMKKMKMKSMKISTMTEIS